MSKILDGVAWLAASHEVLDTQHKTSGHTESTPRAGEGLRAGVARLGRAAQQSQLLELHGSTLEDVTIK